MSSFTVTNNSYLRNLYKSTDSTLSKKSARNQTAKGKLVIADTSALRKGISTLYDEDYGDADEADTDSDKEDFKNKMHAFADAYNYTLDSSSSYGSSYSKKAVKQIKSLVDTYGDDLTDLGVSFDDKGYMTLSDSAFDNIDEAEFEDTFGSDSDFMQRLDSIAKKLNRHIDLSI